MLLTESWCPGVMLPANKAGSRAVRDAVLNTPVSQPQGNTHLSFIVSQADDDDDDDARVHAVDVALWLSQGS